MKSRAKLKKEIEKEEWEMRTELIPKEQPIYETDMTCQNEDVYFGCVYYIQEMMERIEPKLQH